MKNELLHVRRLCAGRSCGAKPDYTQKDSQTAIRTFDPLKRYHSESKPEMAFSEPSTPSGGAKKAAIILLELRFADFLSQGRTCPRSHTV